jgi:hypothetical protein
MFHNDFDRKTASIGRNGATDRLEEEVAESNDNLHHAQAPAVLDHSRTLPQGDGCARPSLARRAVGDECNLIVLDAGDVLHGAFADTRDT